MLEYKVLSERDSRFSGKFDLDQLENELNSCAADGWRIAGGLSAMSIWKNAKSEILVFLERDSRVGCSGVAAGQSAGGQMEDEAD
jgi:hypothetical protein